MLKSEILKFTALSSTAHLKLWIMSEKSLYKTFVVLRFDFYSPCYQVILVCKFFLNKGVKISDFKIYIFKFRNALEISKLCKIKRVSHFVISNIFNGRSPNIYAACDLDYTHISITQTNCQDCCRRNNSALAKDIYSLCHD